MGELSIAEQLGHVGSEISRAVRWASRNPDVARGAVFRALELIDLTLADHRHRQSVARLREIARAREVVVDFFVGSNQYGFNLFFPRNDVAPNVPAVGAADVFERAGLSS